MTAIKAFAHQFLGTAVDDQELTSEEIASICNMDENTVARIIEYLKGKKYIKEIKYANEGDSYPATFMITAACYDWVEKMDCQNNQSN